MATNPIDRTGLELTTADSLVVIEVIEKALDQDIYLLQDHIKGNPNMKSGGYFVTGVQLEVMKVGYETGLWLNGESLDE